MTTRRVSGRRAARTSAGSVVPSAAQGTRSNSTPSSAKAVSGRSTELCSREEHTTCPGDLLNIPFKTMLSACVAFMVKITREGSEIPHNLDTARRVLRVLLRTRRAVSRLCGISDPSRVIFTMNATHALNMVLKGMLRRSPGHVVCSSLEHNSVLRPLTALAEDGVEFERVPCAADGTTDPADVLAALRPDTRLVVMNHASNVLGTLLPVEGVGPALRERGVPFLVDGAQTAGSFSLDVEEMCIDFLALPGHKGLLGPQGVGVLYVGEGMEMDTLMEGGTGGDSSSPVPPQELPDRYEAGTPNTPGIAGLGAGVELVLAEGVGRSDGASGVWRIGCAGDYWRLRECTSMGRRIGRGPPLLSALRWKEFLRRTRPSSWIAPLT